MRTKPINNLRSYFLYGCLLFSFVIASTLKVVAQEDKISPVQPIYGDRLHSKVSLKSMKQEGNYVLYDDMYLPTATIKSASPLRAGRWANGVLPINFSPSVNAEQRAVFQIACDWWGTVAKITCQPRTSEKDFINVMSSNENSSFVGRIGGAQNLKMYNWNVVGIIAHEIGHALGLTHEHMRPDRDLYVIIVFPNIQSNATRNFDRIDAELWSYYDYESVMHYSPTSFTSNGQPTIIPLVPQAAVNMGQRNYLSRRDELAAMKMYGARDGGPLYALPNLIGQKLSTASSLLRVDYGMTITVSSGPSRSENIKYTICEYENRFPVIISQTPPMGQRVSFGSAVTVATEMRSDFHMYPPPKGHICP